MAKEPFTFRKIQAYQISFSKIPSSVHWGSLTFYSNLLLIIPMDKPKKYSEHWFILDFE